MDDDEGGAPDTWAARHIMRNADVKPPWVDLRSQIDERAKRIALRMHAHQQWLRDRTRLLSELPADRIVEAAHATATRDARVRDELIAALSELNALVRRYDLIVPGAMQLPLYTLDRLASN